jgi:hypothetical protein
MGDESIVPVRGQIAWLAPQPEVHYGLYYNSVSILPRSDGIVVQYVGDSDMFGVGIAALLGWVSLPAGMEVVTSPWVLGTAGALAVVEFFADKIPGLDSLWDGVHTFIRIPAGAALAAAVFSGLGGADQAAWTTIAALLGGTLAATAHTAKATTRAAVNTSPEPFSNIGLSLPGVFVGSFLIEVFFSIPGLGREILLAVNRSDYPVIQAIAVYLAVLTMVINLIVDVMFKLVDPRVVLK